MRLLSFGTPAMKAAIAGLATLPCMTWAIAQDISRSATAAELAAGIAETMNTHKPATSGNSLITQETTSNGNLVESRMTFKDPKAFVNAAAQKQKLQAGTTRYMCKAERLPFIKKGVVFRNIFIGPDPMDAFSFDIDERACASLQTLAIADPATLAKLASAIAKALPGEPAFPGSKFAAVEAHEGDIKLSYDIVAPMFIDFFKYKAFEIRGKTQGALCLGYGDAIHRGVRIQVVFKMGTTVILEFPADNSVC